MKNDRPPYAATLRSWARWVGVYWGGGGGVLQFYLFFVLARVVFVSSTSIRGGKVSVCVCLWQAGRVEEGPPAERRESHAASWRSCQDSAARASNGRSRNRVPAARESDALQVQISQSAASSTRFV